MGGLTGVEKIEDLVGDDKRCSGTAVLKAWREEWD